MHIPNFPLSTAIPLIRINLALNLWRMTIAILQQSIWDKIWGTLRQKALKPAISKSASRLGTEERESQIYWLPLLGFFKTFGVMKSCFKHFKLWETNDDANTKTLMVMMMGKVLRCERVESTFTTFLQPSHMILMGMNAVVTLVINIVPLKAWWW